MKFPFWDNEVCGEVSFILLVFFFSFILFYCSKEGIGNFVNFLLSVTLLRSGYTSAENASAVPSGLTFTLSISTSTRKE